MAGANSNTFQHVLEVASVAALSNVHVAELDFGARAWVDSVQTSFYLTDAPALVPNGSTIIGPAPGAAAGKASARWVIEQSGGGGSLAIENNQVLVTPTRDTLNFDNSFAVADDPGNLSTDVSLRTGEPYISQADWYIDPVAGDDTAAGTIGAPLKTLTEWANRMGQSTIQITMNVHVLSDLADDDMPMGPINVGVGGVLTIEATPIVVQSSTFSAVTTANPATNTPWSATAAAVNWGAVIEAGQRVRMTAGASAGTVAWPMFDHGGGVSDFSWPMTSDPTLGPYGQSQQTLTANTFDVEQLVKLTNFSLRVQVAVGAEFQLVDVDVGGASYALDNAVSQSSLYGCQLRGAASEIGANYINTGSTAQVSHPGGSSVVAFGGLVLGSLFVDSGSFFAIDFDFAIQGGNLQVFSGGDFTIGTAQIFNWPGGASGAGGVQLWQFAQLIVEEFVSGPKRVWGSSAGADTLGFRIQDGAVCEYEADVSGLTILGALGAASAVELSSDGVFVSYSALPIYIGLSSRARRVTADVPNATDNLLNANDLAFTVNADGEFFLTMSLTLTADSTGAIGFQLTAPGGPTGTFTAQYVSSIPTAGVFPINTRVNKTVGAGGELVGLLITGSFQAGTDAVVTFQFASVGAGTTTLNENSGLSVVRKDPDAQFAGMTIE